LTNGPNFKQWHSNPLPSAALCGPPDPFGPKCSQQYRTWADINGDGWDDLFVHTIVIDNNVATNAVKTFIRNPSVTNAALDLVEATGAGNPMHDIGEGAPAFADLGVTNPWCHHNTLL